MSHTVTQFDQTSSLTRINYIILIGPSKRTCNNRFPRRFRRFTRSVPHATRLHGWTSGSVFRMHTQTVDRLRDDNTQLFVDHRWQEYCWLRRDTVRRWLVPSWRKLLVRHGHETTLPLPSGAFSFLFFRHIIPTRSRFCHKCNYLNICLITKEFTGDSCNKQAPCTEFKCQNKGHCVSESGNTTFVCKCPPGWDGPFCTKGMFRNDIATHFLTITSRNVFKCL